MENRSQNNGSGIIAFGLIMYGVFEFIRPFLPFKVVINWSYPRELNSALYSEDAFYGWGIYCITNKYKGNESLLYIGKAYNSSFGTRLKSHLQTWIDEYPGKKYVRFGSLKRPLSVGESTIHDVESALIWEHQPIHNKMQKNSYTYTHKRTIFNRGNRGLLNSKVTMNNH